MVMNLRVKFLEKLRVGLSRRNLIHAYTGLFIRPSGTSELDCATTKKDRAERSISTGTESLKVFFFFVQGPWRTCRFHC